MAGIRSLKLLLYLYFFHLVRRGVRAHSIGRTWEGRRIMAISFSKAGPGRPNILVEAGKKAINYL